MEISDSYPRVRFVTADGIETIFGGRHRRQRWLPKAPPPASIQSSAAQTPSQHGWQRTVLPPAQAGLTNGRQFRPSPA